MENNKYYPPNAEDFNVGVECQVYYPREKVWKDRKIRHWEDLNEVLSRFVTDNTSVRFKYLDEEDILDLGFKHIGDKLISEYWKDNYRLYYDYNYKKIKITDDNENISYEVEGGILFSGKIKNKNGLQKLLKQIEINGN